MEPEVSDEEVDGTHEDGYTFTASIRRVLTCGECGTELKDTTFDVDHSDGFTDYPECSSENKGHTYEVKSCTANPTERTEGKGRGMKTFYGFEGEADVVCEKCSHKVHLTFDDEAQAFSFDEC